MRLREALFLAADALERNQVNYHWNKQSHCNCGVVAQAITGMPQIEVGKQFHKLRQGNGPIGETWSEVSRAHCPITGMPVAEFLMRLWDAGLTRDNIVHLEYLSDPEILRRCTFRRRPYYYQDRDNLIEYLRAWAGMLPPPLPDTEVDPEKLASIEAEAAACMRRVPDSVNSDPA